MNEICYANSQWIAPAELSVSVHDIGFLWGVTVSERIRTIGGKPFLLNEHLRRFAEGLRVIAQDHVLGDHDLASIVETIAEHNHRLGDPGDDLGINLFVTPGESNPMQDAITQPTVVVYSYRLPFTRWTKAYDHGVVVIPVDVRQVPSDCWPTSIKCRSRMHYYRADLEAQRVDSQAVGLLLDEAGSVAECATANLIAAFSDGCLASPPKDRILPGITLGYVERLVRHLDMEIEYRDIPLAELYQAAEIMLTSTPYCVQPARRLGEKDLPVKRPVYDAIRHQWHTATGVDFVAQSQRFARRSRIYSRP